MEHGGGLVWLAEVDEAAAVAEESESLLGDDTELFPAAGGVGVAGCGWVVLEAVLGDCGFGGGERVMCVGSVGVPAGGESFGEVGQPECERGADERGRIGGVVRGAVVGCFGDFGEKCRGAAVVSELRVGEGDSPRPSTMESAAPSSRVMVSIHSR